MDRSSAWHGFLHNMGSVKCPYPHPQPRFNMTIYALHPLPSAPPQHHFACGLGGGGSEAIGRSSASSEGHDGGAGQGEREAGGGGRGGEGGVVGV